MTGPKLENALQGLQQAIDDLDQTIMDTTDKIRAQEASLASMAGADSGLPANNLQAENLRAELMALREMIHQANDLINGKQDASASSVPDEVIH